MTRDPVKAMFWVFLLCVLVGVWAHRSFGDTLQCSSIKDNDKRAYCRAVTSNDPLYCSSIHNPTMRAECRAIVVEEVKTQDEDYVDFGDVARHQIGQQCQYAARYLSDPALSAGLRWKGKIEDYHFITLHKDDVEVFVERVLAWMKVTGQR